MVPTTMKNYEATTTIIATMTPRLMAAARRKIGRRPTILKTINSVHCQRPPNVKNVVVDVTCGGIPQQWMKAR